MSDNINQEEEKQIENGQIDDGKRRKNSRNNERHSNTEQ